MTKTQTYTNQTQAAARLQRGGMLSGSGQSSQVFKSNPANTEFQNLTKEARR